MQWDRQKASLIVRGWGGWEWGERIEKDLELVCTGQKGKLGGKFSSQTGPQKQAMVAKKEVDLWGSLVSAL